MFKGCAMLGIGVKACNYAGQTLKLFLKLKIAGKTADGVPFLGFLVKPSGIHLQQKTKRRYKARFAGIEYEMKQGIMSEADAGCRMESVTAHLLIARSRVKGSGGRGQGAVLIRDILANERALIFRTTNCPLTPVYATGRCEDKACFHGRSSSPTT